MACQTSTLEEIDMDRTTRRITTRLTASVAAGLLTVGLAGSPATALRLVPVDPPTVVVAGEPSDDPSLLLSLGRVSLLAGTPTGEDTGPDTGVVNETVDGLFMSSGRLPR
jgi:hypothetical protein